jgi:hypothetical protein
MPKEIAEISSSIGNLGLVVIRQETLEGVLPKNRGMRTMDFEGRITPGLAGLLLK